MNYLTDLCLEEIQCPDHIAGLAPQGPPPAVLPGPDFALEKPVGGSDHQKCGPEVWSQSGEVIINNTCVDRQGADTGTFCPNTSCPHTSSYAPSTSLPEYVGKRGAEWGQHAFAPTPALLGGGQHHPAGR